MPKFFSAMIAAVALLILGCSMTDVVMRVPESKRSNFKVEYFIVYADRLADAVVSPELASQLELEALSPRDRDIPLSGFSVVVFITHPYPVDAWGDLELKFPDGRRRSMQIGAIASGRRTTYVFDCGSLAVWPGKFEKKYAWTSLYSS